MPKLDATHLPERLRKRIAELEQGQELSAKDIKAVLTPVQLKALGDAWAAQQLLRKEKRARTEDEQRALGWKSKREVRLDILRQALVEARAHEPDAWKAKQAAATERQLRTYLDALEVAKKAGKDKHSARNWANNELTRAGLRRMDGGDVRGKSKRDRDVEAAEEQILQKMRETMTAEELEQLDLLAEGEEQVGRRKPT